jgi:hypothetical protein
VQRGADGGSDPVGGEHQQPGQHHLAGAEPLSQR